MPERFIPPYEQPEWNEWRTILSRDISDAADFDDVMTQLHGAKYAPKSFSNFLYNYYLNESDSGVFGDVTINNRPEVKKVNKRELFSSILPFIQGLVVKFPGIMYSFMMSKTGGGVSAEQINKLSQDHIIKELIDNGSVYPLCTDTTENIMIPRTHVTAVLACAFFGLFDLYNCHESEHEFRSINFLSFITSNNITAFECIINYFSRVQHELPAGNIIIRRIKSNKKTDVWARNAPLPRVRLYTNIISEHAQANVQLVNCGNNVHFADSISSSSGSIEINDKYVRYLIHPELFVLTIFVEPLVGPLSSLIVLGVETYSSIIYSDKALGVNSIKYSGEYYDNVQRVRNGTPARTLIFIQEPKTDHAGRYLDTFKTTLDTMYESIQTITGGFSIDVSVGPWSELQYLQLLLAASAVGNTRIHYHRNNMLESNKIPDIISRIEDFMISLAKHNAGMNKIIVAYNKFSQDLRRDRDNNYGEYDAKRIKIFDEIIKRLN